MKILLYHCLQTGPVSDTNTGRRWAGMIELKRMKQVNTELIMTRTHTQERYLALWFKTNTATERAHMHQSDNSNECSPSLLTHSGACGSFMSQWSVGWCRQTHKNQSVTKSTAALGVGVEEQVKKKRKLVKVRVNVWWHRPAVIKQSRIFGFKWSSDLWWVIDWWWNRQNSTNPL